jgi:spore coat protein SA
VTAPAGLPSVAVLLSGREQFSPYFGGAVARWTYEVYSRLTSRLAPTVFGFPTEEKDLYPLPHETSRIWRTCIHISHTPGVRRFEEILWLRALIGRLREFDVVHIHNRPQWVAMLRKMRYQGAIILHLHNNHIGHWSGPALEELASKLDALVTCSNYLRSTFASKSSLLNAKTHVVFNGANLQLFHPRAEVREPETILFVGRFDPEKGVLQLMQAYERVLDAHPHARLVIAGSAGFGSHRETPYVRKVRDLAARIERQKRGRIHFTGYLDHDTNLPLWFQKATVFASPSLFQEPFGLVNVEAMGCATPVVGANRGGIPEVVGDAGRLADPENAAEFAGAISELLSNPQLCRHLGQAAYERCRKIFDWAVTAETWLSLVGVLLLSKSSTSRGEAA